MEIMNNKKLSIVIMAAGRGTRMNSELPKVLHRLSGETLLNHVIATAEELTPENIVTVVGHEAQMVQDSVNNNDILLNISKGMQLIATLITVTTAILNSKNILFSYTKRSKRRRACCNANTKSFRKL